MYVCSCCAQPLPEWYNNNNNKNNNNNNNNNEKDYVVLTAVDNMMRERRKSTVLLKKNLEVISKRDLTATFCSYFEPRTRAVYCQCLHVDMLMKSIYT